MATAAEESNPSGDLEILDGAVARLSEHFESVSIVVTKRVNGNSRSIVRGGGNWYASYGATREWLVRMDEAARDTERGGE